ncbi:MAG: acetyl-CoA hydrolase/transferase C-terminal domain-containing protein [Thalassobaculum sp.]|uniref:acetyl-CoA hydrolase/transferase family protein n=1 Tax=Thalassobaculum sp. TaxID=2022740 RepID=UPI0032EFC1B0
MSATADMIDFAGLVRPGDTVVVGQASGDPTALSEALVRQRHALGPLTVFVGALFSDSFAPAATDGLAFSGYGAIGGAGALARAGRLDVVPAQYSRIPGLFADGILPVDVALLQLARDGDGRLGLACNNDYSLAAARRARTVIAEVNDRAPFCFGAEWPDDLEIALTVETSRPLAELAPARIGPVEERIAELVAGRIPDGAVIQTGIGAMPDAILSALAGHRDLGVHSGMLGDRFLDLIEAGAVSNARKPFDTGITTGGSLFGTGRLFRFADRNPAVKLVPPAISHGVDVMARLPGFTAINSAVEVDLSGQVNAEVAGNRYVGAVGGQVDFVRAGNLAPGGRSIIALPSTARDGAVSRIVASLDGRPVTSLRSDADLVVTEWGVAELKGRSLAERARRMIAIADPAFRDDLERAAGALLKSD